MANFITENQLLQSLQWRYATKVFDANRKIPTATWNALQSAVVLSASSFGLQPYQFIVVNDPQIRAQLMPQAWNQTQVVDASHLIVFVARTNLGEAELDRFIARIAEVRGVSAESLVGYRQMMAGSLLSEAGQARVPQWAARQAYIALGNLLTSAALLGVDACPIEGFVPAEFDRILGLTEQGYAAVVCCALGYRSVADKYAALPKVRFPVADLVQVV